MESEELDRTILIVWARDVRARRRARGELTLDQSRLLKAIDEIRRLRGWADDLQDDEAK